MKITEIEKQIVDLKLKERELMDRQTKTRVPLLSKAENLPLVQKIINDFFINTMGADKKSISKYSIMGASEGRNREEFLSEIQITIQTDKSLNECKMLSVNITVDSGFEDINVRKKESEIMDEIESTRAGFNELLARKKDIKNQIKPDK